MSFRFAVRRGEPKGGRRRRKRHDRRPPALSPLRLEALEERLMLEADFRDFLIADPVSDSILRFDGETGAPLGAFVASGAAGLVDPHDPTFGPDGNLYIFSDNNSATPQILRYNGATGAFLDVFLATGSGGFDGGSQMAFSPGGDLYVATNSDAGVLRYDGDDGSFVGTAATVDAGRRAIGLDFGPNGDLYVLDTDTQITTFNDRVARFDPDNGTLVAEFVAPGVLDDPSELTFGPDGHLYIPDVRFETITRFTGTTGDSLGAFTFPVEAAASPIFDTIFGPDGNAYAATAERILRFDGESGTFLDTYIDGVGGTIAFFAPDGPPADLAVTSVLPPPGAVQGTEVSITYTVENIAGVPTPVDEWVDVVYVSDDADFDPGDAEVGRVMHMGGLAAGADYTETVTALLPALTLGEYRVFVLADRLGQAGDSSRANNVAIAADTLEVFPLLATSHDPDDSIAVGRTLSAYTTVDIVGGTMTITYSVYNLTDGYVQDVALTTTLEPGVVFDNASQAPTQTGQRLDWDLGTIAPYGRVDIDVVVTFPGAVPLQLDGGPAASGVLDTVDVADDLVPAVLRTDAIAAALLAATPDANSEDPFLLAKAAELNQNPDEIFAYLTSEVGYESYAGSLRGSRGTMWSEAGNAMDQASLLVGLLRASGIPARYAEGTLSVASAQELILSMFPEPYQVIGFVPAGADVSDPANDPGLLAETQDHYWVQFDAGAGFVNADPTFAGAPIGDTFTALDGTFNEVPDAMRHKVTIRLNRELANSASALFGGGTTLDVATVIDETFNAVDLVGRPLSIGHFIDSSSLGFVIASTTNTYSPYLRMGDEASTDLLQDEVFSGESYQEVLTNFPLGSQVLTGLFLNVDLEAPDGTVQSYERALLDRIGFDVRTNGGTPQLGLDPSGAPALTNTDVFTLYVLPGEQNPQTEPAADWTRSCFWGRA